MSTTGQPGFDRTIQETNTWLNEISDALGDPRRPVAYHALRGTLFALRDRLPVEEVFDLAAQFPMLLRGLFFEGYRPKNKPEKYHREEFLGRVRDELEQAGGANVEEAVRAVFRTLEQHVGDGEVRDVREALPEDLRALWPAAGQPS
jgi:uncharacterized protein (DUF2267 family)